MSEEDNFTITLLSCLLIIIYLTNGEKKGHTMTTATLQMFLEGNPDSTLKNFFRRPFLQKPSGIAGNTMEKNTPASVAATITSSSSWIPALWTHALAQQYQVAVEEEGPVQQEPIEELGSEVTREETFTFFNPFIEVIHIIRITDHEDLDIQQPSTPWTI